VEEKRRFFQMPPQNDGFQGGDMDISSISALSGNMNAPVEAPSARPNAPEQRNLIQAVKAINATDLLGPDNELTFVRDRATRRTVVRIVNRATRELIQQIPTEAVLRLAEESK
jgi:uncharacterized FlaG/YvyC family protein